MSKQSEKRFEEITNESLEKMTRVECSIADYAKGLEHLISESRMALQAAREDLAREEAEASR